jgi:hypothetical protein
VTDEKQAMSFEADPSKGEVSKQVAAKAGTDEAASSNLEDKAIATNVIAAITLVKADVVDQDEITFLDSIVERLSRVDEVTVIRHSDYVMHSTLQGISKGMETRAKLKTSTALTKNLNKLKSFFGPLKQLLLIEADEAKSQTSAEDSSSEKGEEEKPSFAEAAKEKDKAKMSWFDICEEESDDEKSIYQEMLNIAMEKDSSELIDKNVVILPDNMDIMPRWHEIIKRACKICKLEIQYSKKTVINGVNTPGLYSVDQDEWRIARESVANDKKTYAAYNSLNQVIQFLARPIDLDTINNPTHGQLWVLYKIALLWHKTAFASDFDLDKFKVGTACGELRPLLVDKLKVLIPRDGETCSELLMSALDRLIYGYIQKIYKSGRGKAPSDYIMKAIKTVSRYGTKWVAYHSRKQTKKVQLVSGHGKNKTTKEEPRVSHFKPNIVKNSLFTGKEDAARIEINQAIDMIPDLLNEVDYGPQLNSVVAENVMNAAWRVHDEFSSLLKTRRGLVRAEALMKRPPENRQAKIQQSEWIAAENALKDTFTDKSVDEIYAKFRIDTMYNDASTQSWVSYLRQAHDLAVGNNKRLQLDWDLFDDDGGNDPSVYHNKLVKDI